jgi:integrase
MIDGRRPGGKLDGVKASKKQESGLVATRASDLRARRDRDEPIAARGPDFDDPSLATKAAEVRDLEDRSHAPRTQEEYRKAFDAFDFWCRRHGYTSMPATINTLRLYLNEQARGPTPRTNSGKMPRSIGVIVAAIAHEHNANGRVSPHQAPIIKKLLKGIRNTKGIAPKQKAPIETDVLLTLLEAIDDDLRNFVPRALAPEDVDGKNRARSKNGRAKQIEAKRLAALRDRALFLTAFGGALRRAEVTAIDREHISFEKEGLKVWIEKSKTDQEKKGTWIYIPKGSGDACPVKAMKAWLAALGGPTDFGPVFVGIDQWANIKTEPLHGNDVARILKRRGASAGFVTAILAGHSFRSGFATSAAKAGKPLSKIMDQGRWKKADTALGYIRMAEGFVNNPADGLFARKHDGDE